MLMYKYRIVLNDQFHKILLYTQFATNTKLYVQFQRQSVQGEKVQTWLTTKPPQESSIGKDPLGEENKYTYVKMISSSHLSTTSLFL